jgi:hypothetical protein
VTFVGIDTAAFTGSSAFADDDSCALAPPTRHLTTIYPPPPLQILQRII